MPQTDVDLRDISRGDEITVQTEGGETFSGHVSEYEQERCDNFRKGWVRAAFEDGLWDQVKDRVDSEVLRVEQKFARKTGTPKKAKVFGTKWNDETPASVELGTVSSIE